jgi:hypothetical protein
MFVKVIDPNAYVYGETSYTVQYLDHFPDSTVTNADVPTIAPETKEEIIRRLAAEKSRLKVSRKARHHSPKWMR